MNREYLREFLERTDFPAEAQAFLLDAADRLAVAGREGDLDRAVSAYAASGFDAGRVQPLLGPIGEAAGISPYTLWLFILVESSLPVREDFRRRGVPESVFWDTFSDVRYKALECQAVYGVWGNFVAFWYDIFFTGKLVKLGRLEYEACPYPWDEPYDGQGVRLRKGDPVYSIHIPSSGEPFDRAARLDSYRRAAAFLAPALEGRPLVCICHSWLLYPPYKAILSPTSNIVSFMGDFEIIGQDESGSEDSPGWRIFGADYQKSPAELPERTSLQRAFKRYLLAGGKTGAGRGVLVFSPKEPLNESPRAL